MNLRNLSGGLALVLALTTGIVSIAAAEHVDLLEGENWDLRASTSRGLRLRVEEPDMVFRIGGRLHADAAFFDADATDLDPDAKLRRGRLYLSGKLLDDVSFKLEREFAPSRGEFRNVWLAYRLNHRFRIRAGNFVMPFGLEQMAASNYSTFMERSMSGSITPGFQTGARLDAAGRFSDRRSRHRWTWALASGTSPLGQVSDDAHRSEHWTVVTRASYAPIARRRIVVHFGGAAEYRDVLGDDEYRIATGTESSQGPRILSTGTLGNVDSSVSVGAEAAALFGPVLLQGEYHRSFLQRSGGSEDVTFDGGYGQVSWVVTGERRRYNRRGGYFGGVRPRSDWGAVELAARYSVIDLEDGPVEGGQAQNLTIGANWYLRENLRFMFNYVRVDAERRTTGISDDPHIFQFRTQLHF